MGLYYHFKLAAPKSVTTDRLEQFLKSVESAAHKMGFGPTFVLNGRFATQEQKDLARRITTGLRISNPRLKNVTLRDSSKVWEHNKTTGECRVVPEAGVLLILTDEQRQEIVFGFLSYPKVLLEQDSAEPIPVPTKGHWVFEQFLKSSDPRYRAIIRLFAAQGFLEHEMDDYSRS